jgi:hypothetical protein
MFKEKRKHKRRALRYPAWIAFENNKLHNCMVLDISEGGAKLDVMDSATIPDHFALLFSQQGSPKRACRVVWRTSLQIGVCFEMQLTEANVSTLAEV